MIEGMEPRQLEAFAAVMSTGSVTGAARLLARSQPAITRLVQELEAEVGYALFTRHDRRGAVGRLQLAAGTPWPAGALDRAAAVRGRAAAARCAGQAHGRALGGTGAAAHRHDEQPVPAAPPARCRTGACRPRARSPGR